MIPFKAKSGTTGYTNPKMRNFAQVSVHHMRGQSDVSFNVISYGSNAESAKENLKETLERVKAECEKQINEIANKT